MPRSRTPRSIRSAGGPSPIACLAMREPRGAGAYRSEPARLATLEAREHLIRKRRIEIPGDPDLALQQTQFLFLHGCRDGTEPRHGLAGLGDDALLAGGDLLDDEGEVSLRLMDIEHFWHGAASDKLSL